MSSQTTSERPAPLTPAQVDAIKDYLAKTRGGEWVLVSELAAPNDVLAELVELEVMDASEAAGELADFSWIGLMRAGQIVGALLP